MKKNDELDVKLGGLLGISPVESPSYCTDWARLGPLMEEHKVRSFYSKIFSEWVATYCSEMIGGCVWRGERIDRDARRAIVKCLIAKLEAEQ